MMFRCNHESRHYSWEAYGATAHEAYVLFSRCWVACGGDAHDVPSKDDCSILEIKVGQAYQDSNIVLGGNHAVCNDVHDCEFHLTGGDREIGCCQSAADDLPCGHCGSNPDVPCEECCPGSTADA